MAREERSEGGVKGMKKTQTLSFMCSASPYLQGKYAEICVAGEGMRIELQAVSACIQKMQGKAPPVPAQLAILLPCAGEDAFGSMTFWVPR